MMLVSLTKSISLTVLFSIVESISSLGVAKSDVLFANNVGTEMDQKSFQESKIVETEESMNRESKIFAEMPEKSVVNDNLDLEHDCAICSKEFASEENLR